MSHVERPALLGGPEHHRADTVLPAPPDRFRQESSPVAPSPQAGLHEHVRQIGVSLHFVDGIGHLLDHLDPDMTPDPTRLLGDPAAPSGAGAPQTFPHPGRASIQKTVPGLDGRIDLRPERVPELGQPSRLPAPAGTDPDLPGHRRPRSRPTTIATCVTSLISDCQFDHPGMGRPPAPSVLAAGRSPRSSPDRAGCAPSAAGPAATPSWTGGPPGPVARARSLAPAAFPATASTSAWQSPITSSPRPGVGNAPGLSAHRRAASVSRPAGTGARATAPAPAGRRAACHRHGPRFQSRARPEL